MNEQSGVPMFMKVKAHNIHSFTIIAARNKRKYLGTCKVLYIVRGHDIVQKKFFFQLDSVVRTYIIQIHIILSLRKSLCF